MTKPPKNDQIWGGTRTFTKDVFPNVVKAWIDLTLNPAQGPKAGSWIAWINGEAKVAATELWYGAPAGNEPAILAPFYNIIAVSDSTKTRGHASYAVENEASNTYGLREIFYDVTFKASYEIAQRSWTSSSMPLVVSQRSKAHSLSSSGSTSPMVRSKAVPATVATRWGLMPMVALFTSSN